MKRVYVSTCRRGGWHKESGKVYCLDLDSGKVLSQIHIPMAMIELPNPRGGSRGARGLAFHNEKLFCAGWDNITRFDPDTLTPEIAWWSKECQDIHQIYPRSHDILWVVSTRNNSLYSFTPVSFIKMEDMTTIHDGIPSHDPDSPDRLHFNSMCESLCLFSSIGVVGDRKSGFYYENEKLLHSHDLFLLPTGEILFNESKKNRTIAMELDSPGSYRVIYQAPDKPDPSRTLARPGWMRGMYYLPKLDQVLLGSAPAQVIHLGNICREPEILGKYQISDQDIDSVFDVITDPRDWHE